MFKKLGWCLCLLASSAYSATIAQMQFVSDSAGSGVFIFNVDGELKQLFCNQFLPNATTLPYEATVSTLADLSGTTLGMQNDPNALQKYSWVAILDSMALADPSIAVDAVKANRRIVDGTGALTPGAQALFDLVQTLNPADFDLSGFRIYTNPITQEVGGFEGGSGEFPQTDTPEPSAFVMLGSGLVAVALWRRGPVRR